MGGRPTARENRSKNVERDSAASFASASTVQVRAGASCISRSPTATRASASPRSRPGGALSPVVERSASISSTYYISDALNIELWMGHVMDQEQLIWQEDNLVAGFQMNRYDLSASLNERGRASLLLHSAAADRDTYQMRPYLGRRLSDADEQALR